MEKIIEILNSIRPEEDFINSDDYIEDGLLDSFDIITLISHLDEAFSISIDGEDIVPENLYNAQAIQKLLLKYGVEIRDEN